MNFFIKQNSKLPVLKLNLYRDGRNDFKRFEDKLENSLITFAMKNTINGTYKVANKEAKLMLKTPCDENSKKEYYIAYEFSEDDTNTVGIFLGEFKIVFLNYQLQPESHLIIPIKEDLYIHVIDSFVKSDPFIL